MRERAWVGLGRYNGDGNTSGLYGMSVRGDPGTDRRGRMHTRINAALCSSYAETLVDGRDGRDRASFVLRIVEPRQERWLAAVQRRE
jgi:hypothetical protein